ncbi:MAG: RNA methyltransferase [Syntrophales bacterium]|nr:RNA methyltransferase [Syntrophales bacterium]
MLLRPSKTQLKYWSKLKMAKYRHQEGVFLAEGVKVVQELIRSPRKAETLMVMEDRNNRWESVVEGLPYPIDTYLLAETEWKGISQDKEPEGIMAAVTVQETLKIEDMEGHLLLGCGISNPNNLGALLRTAHWFGIRNVVISRDSVDIAHPKVVRSSMGSVFHLNIVEEADFATLIPKLKMSHLIVGTDAALGVPPHRTARRTALIMGNESHGLPPSIKSLADECWSIPGTGGAESLSLPQAAAIMIYELTGQGIN